VIATADLERFIADPQPLLMDTKDEPAAQLPAPGHPEIAVSAAWGPNETATDQPQQWYAFHITLRCNSRQFLIAKVT